MTVKERENYESEMRTELDIIAERQFAVEKGQKEALKKVAKAMLAKGKRPEEIAVFTGLSSEDISSIK